MKFRVLKNNVFGEGYLQGDIIEREPHAMDVYLSREEVEEVKEVEVKVEKSIDVVKKAIKEIKEDKKNGAIVCDKCNKEFKSKGGLTVHKRTCKKK